MSGEKESTIVGSMARAVAGLTDALQQSRARHETELANLRSCHAAEVALLKKEVRAAIAARDAMREERDAARAENDALRKGRVVAVKEDEDEKSYSSRETVALDEWEEMKAAVKMLVRRAAAEK